MNSGNLLDVQPTELKFPFELGKQSSCFINVSNESDQYVAFKVKTTNPKRYCVRPNSGIVLPGSTCHIAVTMEAQKEVPPDLECKDNFLVQCVVADEGTNTKDITSDMFVKEPGKVVEEIKLRVAYAPANRPSPLPEESKEGLSRRSRLLEDGNQSSSLFDAVPRSLSESVKENSPPDVLRKGGKNNPGHGFSIIFIVVAGLLGIISGYFMKKK